MKRILGTLALMLTVAALTAGAAFADGGKPAGPPPGKEKAGAPTFTCDGAKARLARIEGRIGRIGARIASGAAKNPDAAAQRLAEAKARAAKVSARIAARCS